ncbi:glycosyltransferase [Shigella flexneri]
MRAIMEQFSLMRRWVWAATLRLPCGSAAWSLGIPVVLHEQNGIAGLTNKWLAKIATTVMQAFPGAFPMREAGGNSGTDRRSGAAVARSTSGRA